MNRHPATAAANDAPLTSGTFLICFALLAFEVSTVRTINFAIGPSFIFIAIALAMLGLTAAGSILSAVDLQALRWRREHVLSAAAIAIAALLIWANILVADAKGALNDTVETAGRSGGMTAILPVLLSQGVTAAGRVGLFLSLPYFLFGALLSYLFATSEPRAYARLYAADLIGAAVGAVAIVAAMEYADYAVSVSLPPVVALLAAAAYAPRDGWKAATLAMLLAAALSATAFGSGAYRRMVEPPSDPNYLVRNYSYRTEMAEVWRRWNSFTRVGAVVRREAPEARATLSLANGDGLAFMWPWREGRNPPLLHRPAMPALLPGPRDDALVLFAGAGADMMSLRENGYAHVTGVELNPTILEGGRALPSYRLDDFLGADGVRMAVGDGRAFLEHDANRYDLILMSWSGATAAYYLGALAGTTQHMYTYEGLAAAFDRLKPDGFAVVLQINKVNAIDALRRYMAARGLTRPERSAIILFRPKGVRAWDGPWEDNPLLFKPAGWSEAEVAAITANARAQGFEVAYAPGRPAHPEYRVYARILTAPDHVAEIARLSAETGLRFGAATDDRPFYLDQFDTGRYLDARFWTGFPDGFGSTADLYHFLRVAIVLAVSAAAFILALAPLVLVRRALPRRRSAGYLIYFLALGAGFMFVEIGIIQRAGILFGNPGLTIAVVLSSVILFAGAGAMMSNRSYARGLTFRANAVAVAAYAVIIALAGGAMTDAALAWPLWARVAGLFAVVAPGAALMGHLFPQGVARAASEDRALAPWAWAINGAMSASVAGLAPLAAQAYGVRSLFLIGAALYLAILLIPTFRAMPAASAGR